VSSESSLIDFRALTVSDLPLLHEWLARPHVAEWWGDPPSMPDVEREYALALGGSAAFQVFIALERGEPIGFMQSYVPAAFHDEGWWLDEHDLGVRGVDVLLADGDRLGQGLGSAMIGAFVDRLFEDPAVTRVQADPSPDNARAIRCYARVGFRPWGEVETPDGRALLMYVDRKTRAEGRPR
jgi:RimJ/RimL family protein N-acetyltransferase